MSGEMKLSYFNVRGRGEGARILLKLAGKEFVDNRIGGEDWQKFKPSTPKGQMPVLEVDGKMICESMAICRYIAREFNLYGSDNWEAATSDQIIETVNSVNDAAAGFKWRAKTEEEKAEALTKLQAALEAFDKFTKLVKKGKFILGDKPSIGDVTVYCAVEFMKSAITECPMTVYATLAEVEKSVAEIPAVAEWIRTRPESTM